ncbi:MAG: histidinol-phosphatase [Lachnospiraceae bacterium]|nr:histidinol-phosphatase [Lachnospiraceae bacterium]
MDYNLHTHTVRCKHAQGTEREYVEEAIKGGFKTLGFSDHTPYPFPREYDPPTRMDPSQLEGYVDTILSLKKEYASDIEILLGLEAEYYPTYFEKLMELIEPYPIEYLLLGQHFPGDEIGQPWHGQETADVERLKGYVDQVLEGLDTGRFLYLAHPDLPNFIGDIVLYEEQMRRLIAECNKRDVPMEINLLGIATERNYPNELFWRLAGEMSAKTVIGVDAHRVDMVWDPGSMAAAEKIAADNHLHLLTKEELFQNYRNRKAKGKTG